MKRPRYGKMDWKEQNEAAEHKLMASCGIRSKHALTLIYLPDVIRQCWAQYTELLKHLSLLPLSLSSEESLLLELRKKKTFAFMDKQYFDVLFVMFHATHTTLQDAFHTQSDENGTC